MIFHLFRRQLQLAKLAGEHVGIAHCHLAPVHVVGQDTRRKLLEAEWALGLLLLAEVRHMLLILGQRQYFITRITDGHVTISIAFCAIFILIIFLRTISIMWATSWAILISRTRWHRSRSYDILAFSEDISKG